MKKVWFVLAFVLFCSPFYVKDIHAATPAAGASCADNTEGATACYVNGCYVCSSGTWVAQPLLMGSTATACGAGLTGMMQWTGTAMQYCNGTSWTSLGGASYLGSAATNTSPSRSDDVTTGLFSDTASTVSIATSGTEALRVTSTGSIGVGTTTPKTSVDFSAKSDGLLIQTATGAADSTCTSTYTGALRYNSSINAIEYCTGTYWVALGTAPATKGYFVLTNTTWTASLGGLSGADAKCYTELTSYDWNGKDLAQAHGQLTTSNIKAFLCDASSCNGLNPSTTYYFAVANSSSAGGASFTTDSSGLGPGDSSNWSGATYFNSATTYWSGRSAGASSTKWPNTPDGTLNQCTNWTSAAAVVQGRYASTNSTASSRWSTGGAYCNFSYHLVCAVNPPL